MKITEVQALRSAPPREFVFAKVTTSNGLVGYGEAANDGAPEVHATAINNLGKRMIGLDPMNTESAYCTLHRSCFGWPPEAVMRAIGALDAALFDIKGQALKTPVYNLLGGRIRERIKLYCHLVIKPGEEATPETYAEGAKRQVALGFRGIKFDPFTAVYRQEMEGKEVGCIYVPQGMNFPRELAAKAIEMVRAVREAVGSEVLIMTDIHGRFDVETAIRVGKLMEPYDLFFYEEPIPPTDVELLAYVRQHVNIPICVGERRYTPEDFKRLFQKNATDIIMPDHARNGGITWMKKISDLAATYYVPVAPHVVRSSPLNAVISAHTMASVPNFLIHESMGPQRNEIYKYLIKPHVLPENGYLNVPDRPGLGVELNEDDLDKEIDEREMLAKLLE